MINIEKNNVLINCHFFAKKNLVVTFIMPFLYGSHSWGILASDDSKITACRLISFMLNYNTRSLCFIVT